MLIKEKLVNIQNELKAPKNLYNNFGKYNYRSAEDVLEALKPLLLKHRCTINITDEIVQIGTNYYNKTLLTFLDIDDTTELKSSVMCKEASAQKGMNEAQISGSTISYCHKYVLGSMFLLDDTKDVDTEEYQKENNKENKTDIQLKEISNYLLEMGDNNKKIAKDLLQMFTKYEDFEGYTSLADLKNIKEKNSKKFYTIYFRIKKKYEEYLTSINANEKFIPEKSIEKNIPF